MADMNNILAQTILNSWLGGNSLNIGDIKKHKSKYSMATCPDSQCGTVLYFPTHEQSVECIGCGQRHTTSKLSDVRELDDKEQQFQRSLTEMKSIYGGKKTAELVKVKGISNYQCKLLSPLLTTHGKDKNDKPCLLKDLGLGEVFDCSKLGSRAFAIEASMLDTTGYGQDKSGSLRYLKDTLDRLSEFNGNMRCLVPVHADGDGHCLVHAISRCLVGRELFWHALRTNMASHLQTHHEQYAAMLKDFYEDNEWPEIIDEASPDYQPPAGQSLGLRTVHIFALANVLRRPIVLLDSIAGMQSKGDYSGIYLPSFHSPAECCTQGILNSPIVIAWSNSGYNHFIPLVPIKDQPLPRLPVFLRPKVWGVGESLLTKYINIEPDGSITLARGKPLQDTYLQKLVGCMEQLFFEKYGVVPSLVADVNQHVYRSAGCVGVSLDTVTMETKSAVEEGRLFRCLFCSTISNVPNDWVCNGGMFCEIASKEYKLEDEQKYSFPRHGITAEYKAESGVFIPIDVNCFRCGQTSRGLLGDNTVLYENGDRTMNRADPQFSKCCGFKHYWNGKEYDNLPQPIRFNLTWKGKTKPVLVYWFQNERDPSLNSNIYDIAYQAVAENFPGEFGSEQLVQQVVDMVVLATEKKDDQDDEAHTPSDDMETESTASDNQPVTKTTITGMNRSTKVLHKEELGVSETERRIKRKVDQKLQQTNTAQQPTTSRVADRTSPIKVGRKTSPSPLNDLSSTTPPPKISPTDKTSSTSSKPSPPSGSSKDQKKVKVTTSEGKNTHLTLSHSATFTDLQLMIEQELNIPVAQQKLRWGFPPKELCPPEDPSAPLPLSHGERVSVERVGGTVPLAKSLDLASPAALSLNAPKEGADDEVTSDLGLFPREFESFTSVEYFPHLFKKGGHCYEELLRSHGNKLKDHSHVQFAEMPDIVFRYSAADECLEVCLGMEHVPVGPLTPEQKELAHLASNQSKMPSDKGVSHHEEPLESHSVKWLVNRASSSSSVKAFSGAGRTLGGTREEAKEQPDEMASYSQTLLQAAQLIVATRMIDLKQRERELQNEIHTLNKQLQSKSEQAESVTSEDKEFTESERRLLDMSSELKELREEMRQLANI